MVETPASVRAFRGELRERWSPRYSGWLHFGFVSVLSLAAIGFALSRLHGVRALELLTVPITFLWANLGEYFGHRGPMHHRRRGLGAIFQRHTVEHHHFFTHDAMACDSARDHKIMLFPPILIVFFLGVLATPIGLALAALLGRNVGYLYLATAMGYFISYEWLHWSYHLPPESWISRLPVVRVLRRHHQAHHDLGLMQRWNFNITFPICDALFGTLYRGARR